MLVLNVLDGIVATASSVRDPIPPAWYFLIWPVLFSRDHLICAEIDR